MTRAQGFNNAEGGGIWAGAVTAISNLGGSAIALGNKTGIQGDVKAICGRQPLFNNNGQKDEWKECAQAAVGRSVKVTNQMPLIITVGVSIVVIFGMVMYAIKS